MGCKAKDRFLPFLPPFRFPAVQKLQLFGFPGQSTPGVSSLQGLFPINRRQCHGHICDSRKAFSVDAYVSGAQLMGPRSGSIHQFLTTARLGFRCSSDEDLRVALEPWGDPDATALNWPFLLLDGNRQAGCAGLRRSTCKCALTEYLFAQIFDVRERCLEKGSRRMEPDQFPAHLTVHYSPVVRLEKRERCIT
jgi:hypothetical protein